MKFDESLLREQGKGESAADTEAAVAMPAGKWTRTRATGADAKEFEDFCDLGSLLDGAKDSDSDSDASRGKTTTVEGAPAITLHEQDGKNRCTLYVARPGHAVSAADRQHDRSGPGIRLLQRLRQAGFGTEARRHILDLDALGG